MKPTSKLSKFSAWMIVLTIGLFTLLNNTSVQAQNCGVSYLGKDGSTAYLNVYSSTQTCLSQAVAIGLQEVPEAKVICIFEKYGQVYFVQVSSANMKGKNKPTALSEKEASKTPGLTKYRPFRGNDDVQISVGAHTLIFHGNEGTANENPLDVCQSEGSQQCKSPNTWVVTKDEKAANGGFRIQPSNDKKAYLCFNGPDGGISVHRNPSSTDECIQWSIVPSQIGKDGEVKGYNIYPTKHPDYVLAVDTRSSQVRVDKVNTKADEAGEPNKALLTNWTFTPGKSKRKVTNQEKVLQNAEQK